MIVDWIVRAFNNSRHALRNEFKRQIKLHVSLLSICLSVKILESCTFAELLPSMIDAVELPFIVNKLIMIFSGVETRPATVNE